MRGSKLYKQEMLKLENKRQHELKMIKQELHKGYEFVKPVNVIKRTVAELATSPEFKGDLFKIGLNLLTGFLSKKIIGKSDSPLKQKLVSTLQSFATNYISKNSQNIKAGLGKLALQLLNKISRKTPSHSDTEPGEIRQAREAA